jgi:hypothetical protein
MRFWPSRSVAVERTPEPKEDGRELTAVLAVQGLDEAFPQKSALSVKCGAVLLRPCNNICLECEPPPQTF